MVERQVSVATLKAIADAFNAHDLSQWLLTGTSTDGRRVRVRG
jgi:hypothetical protein